jgi:hypothetical protein
MAFRFRFGILETTASSKFEVIVAAVLVIAVVTAMVLTSGNLSRGLMGAFSGKAAAALQQGGAAARAPKNTDT